MTAAWLPGVARADCATETRLVGLGASFGQGPPSYSAKIAQWRLGNCGLLNGRLHFRDGAGTFDANVHTTFTHNKDIWHFRLQLFTGTYGDPKTMVLKFDQAWDGPEMSEPDKPPVHPWHVDFTYDRALDLGKVFGLATSCC